MFCKRFIKKVLYLSAIFCCFCCSAKSLTLDEAMNTGLLNNPWLQAEMASLEIKDAEIKKANLRANPRLIVETAPRDSYYNAYIDQLFETGGKRKQRFKIAKIDKEMTLQQIRQDVISLKTDIANSYITHYCNQLRLNAYLDIYSKAQTLLNTTKLKQKGKLNIAEAEIYLLKYLNNINNAKGEYERSFNNLNALLGGSLNKDEKLEKPQTEMAFKNLKDPDNSEKEISDIISNVYQNSPFLNYHKKGIEKAESMEKAARLNAVPNTVLSAGSIMYFTEARTAGFYGAIGIDIPVFNRGQADLKLAKAYKNHYSKQLLAEENKISAEIQNLYSEIKQNYNAKKLYEEKILPKSEVLLKQADEDFAKGRCDELFTVIAHENFLNFKLNYIDITEKYEKVLNEFIQKTEIAESL